MPTKEEFLSALGKARAGDIFNCDQFLDPDKLAILEACMPKGRHTPAGFIPHFKDYKNHIRFVFDLAANNGCILGCLYCFQCPQDGVVLPAELFLSKKDILFMARYKAAFSNWFFKTFGEKCHWIHGEKYEIGAEKKARTLYRELVSEMKRQSKNWHVTHYTKNPAAWINARAFSYTRKHITWLLTWSNGNHYPGLEPNVRTIEEREWLIRKMRGKRLFAVHAVLSGPKEAWKFRRFLERNPWILEASWTMYKFRKDEEQQYEAYVGCVGKYIASNLTKNVGGGFLAVGKTNVMHKIDEIVAGTKGNCKIVCDRKGQPALVLKYHHNVRGYLVCANGLGAAACPVDNARIHGCSGIMYKSQNIRSRWKVGSAPQEVFDEAEKLGTCPQIIASPTIALRYIQIDNEILKNNLKARGLNYKNRETLSKILQQAINQKESQRAIGRAA